MTAATLIRELADTGVRLSRRGDRLHVEARRGAITPDLRQRLVEHKAELLAALDGAEPTEPITARLRRVAQAESLDPALADRLPAGEESEYAALTDDQLSGLLAMWRDDSFRFAGRPAPGDTAAVLCKGCGPVLINPAIAKMLPVVGRWPRALGCPWCFVRKRGVRIPRPPVTCSGCVHRVPDSINPDGGMGRCAVRPDVWRFPHQPHTCPDWRPARC